MHKKKKKKSQKSAEWVNDLNSITLPTIYIFYDTLPPPQVEPKRQPIAELYSQWCYRTELKASVEPLKTSIFSEKQNHRELLPSPNIQYFYSVYLYQLSFLQY